ncbi:hypothetical protein L3N51_01485 [Metallosphaera sp. J1]|uniref:hypothetical protein n=1 Tax=Metallosphaera javensis (ex Hofmann et al. 2022) TaxID=99938 RepID=UPI001EE0D304|nr:hypothetical protein [Metallosphaera javensis (ex Hofmann et al. 2022)]MCG3109195.1 hypothetical protein [Metallosphaera javensis (ex Hofmann et al. 2022)]
MLLSDQDWIQGIINCLKRRYDETKSFDLAYLISISQEMNVSDFRIKGDSLYYYDESSTWVDCSRYLQMFEGFSDSEIHEAALAAFRWLRLDVPPNGNERVREILRKVGLQRI